MYTFKPFYNDRYYIITIQGELTPDDCKSFVQDMLTFSSRINFKPFGSVNDMREFTEMNKEASDILVQGMQLSLKVGFRAVGRVFKDITQDMIKSMREANMKAGFLASYHTEIDDAVSFVKKVLSHNPETPTTTKQDIQDLVKKEYSMYHLD